MDIEFIPFRSEVRSQKSGVRINNFTETDRNVRSPDRNVRSAPSLPRSPLLKEATESSYSDSWLLTSDFCFLTSCVNIGIELPRVRLGTAVSEGYGFLDDVADRLIQLVKKL